MTDTCYVGIVGPETDPSNCRDSIHALRLRNGDGVPRWMRATKGYEARQAHLEDFEKTTHDWCLLLDHDMIFASDTLERLRTHKVSYVSGFYMRRQFAPIVPVWFKQGPVGVQPMEPWVTVPEREKLHKLGASGWGCVLLHRSVLEDVKPILKGEDYVIEDDMDIYPYDLERMFGALQGLEELVNGNVPARTLRLALAEYQAVLADELRPLRAHKSVVGSDIRFPFFARLAGHTLWGDPEVRPAHSLMYPLTCDDFEQLMTPEMLVEMKKSAKLQVRKGRKILREFRERVGA